MKYCFVLILFSVNLSLSAQSTTGNLADDSTKVSKVSLTLASIYSSNITYYGQTSAERLPNVLGYAEVKFPIGFWLSGYAYKLLDSEPGISATNLSVGYDFSLSKKLSGSISYGRSFYPDSSQLIQSVNEDVATVSLSYDWQWLSTDLIADYAIGQTNALYTTFKASKLVDLGLSLSSKDYFTLEPSFEIVGSNQQFSTSPPSDETPPEERKKYFDKLLDKGLPKRNGFQPVKGIIPGKKGNEDVIVSSAPYNLISYSFKLPLAYNRGNYTLETGYEGVIVSKVASDSQKLQSFFNLGFYYTF